MKLCLRHRLDLRYWDNRGGQKAVRQGWPSPRQQQPSAMSNSSDFTVKVCNDRDIVISKPEAEFEVTYRREVCV